MNIKLAVLLFVLAAAAPLLGAQKLPARVQTVDDFAPANRKIDARAEAELDRNGAAETVEAVAKIRPAAEDEFAAPTYSAEEIGRRLLRFVTDIGRPADLSPENLEKNFGGKIVYDAGNAARYGYAGKIAGSDWFYQFFSLAGAGGGPAELEFGFGNARDAAAELTPVCGIGYAEYRKELAGAGFSVTPAYGEHGRLLFYQFEKGAVGLKIATRRYEPNECVETIRISVAN